MAPSSQIHKCVCGKSFKEDCFRRHLNKCSQNKARVKETAERYQAAVREKRRREILEREEREREHILEESQTHSAVEEEHIQETPTNPRVFQDYLPHRTQGLQYATSGPLLRLNQLLEAASDGGQHGSGGSDPATATSRDTNETRPQKQRSQRSAGARRLPGSYRDLLPEGPAPLASPSTEPPAAQSQDGPDDNARQETHGSSGSHSEEVTTPVYRTLRNAFNVFREYLRKPLRIPDEGAPLESLLVENGSLDAESLAQRLSDTIEPFGNMSIYRIGHWFHSCGGRLSRELLASLITDVLKAEDFSPDDLPGAQTMDRLNAALDGLDRGKSAREEERDTLGVGDGWIEESVRIEIPTGVKQPNKPSNNHPPPSTPFDIPGLFRRPLVEVIKAACQDDLARDFHYEPFRSFQARPSSQADNKEVLLRLHDELYASDAWISEQQKLDSLPPEPGCNLPRAIAALMFWSDATHVSQFGQSKMWPVYLFFGNLSKWLRCKPQSRASHHVAHIPTLPDNIQDFIRAQGNGKSASVETLRHCRRELFHAVWARLVQDPAFLEAYRHGIVIKCADGITRRIYPRIFTYSTDYPERVLVATIRDLGHCPCPLCLVTLDQVGLLGQVADERTRTRKVRVDTAERVSNIEQARKIIYMKGYAPGNEHSDYFLQSESLVATENAFSKALREEFSFDYFRMLVVDLLHEFELGVWKAVFLHLVRMLYTVGKDTVNEFNHRFRRIGNFGRSTIRSFAYMNVTDMKNWAARTYEDCLQCCIPCFEGLFPEPHNTHILRLLYTLALWHGLAKLRQHTDVTLEHLSTVTRMLGKELRFFASEVCRHFNTTETPKERDARNRRENAKTMKSSKSDARAKGKTKVTSPLPKTFSLRTVKIHLLGHYVPTIRWFGTTDSYSTQIGELEHRVVKSYYRRGNKKDYVRLATQMQRRGEQLHRVTESIRRLGVKAGHKSHRVDRSNLDPLPPFSPEHHHQIAKSKSKWLHIGELVSTSPSEPAFQNFIPTLKDHILGRLAKRPFDGEEGIFSDEDRDHVIIMNNLLYCHSKMRVNYTTYNIQRDQDIINPSVPSRSFIMVKAPETEKACFWYARVLGIYRLQVIHRPSGIKAAQTLEVLWIRWLGEDPEYTGGLGNRRLERVGYVPAEDDGAFGFIDPAVVIRGAHLIPSFTFDKTTDLLPESKYWDSKDGDWVNYYVNPFVDRDMLSRFLGTGAGHVALGTMSEPDIAKADTTPEPPAIPDHSVSAEPGDETNFGDEYNSEEDRATDGEGGADGEEEIDGFPSGSVTGGADLDVWEYDDDEEWPQDDDFLLDYDYSN